MSTIRVLDLKDSPDGGGSVDLDCDDESWEKIVELGEQVATEDDFFTIGFRHYVSKVNGEEN